MHIDKTPTIQVVTRAGLIAFILGAWALNLVTTSPLFQPVPGRDSGAFLYAGFQLLDGQALYRDFWDHKGPLIAYLNALGLALGGGSLWGVWWLRGFFLTLAALIGYLGLRRAFGPLAALAASALWLGALPRFFEGGNLVEEYGLVFQFSAAFLGGVGAHQGRARWRSAALGVCLATCLLLRPNMAVFPAVAILVGALWQRRIREASPVLSGAAVGGIGLLGFVLWELGRKGALQEAFDCVIGYNLVYSSGGLGAVPMVFERWLELAGVAGWLIWASWLCAAVVLLARRAKKQEVEVLLTLAVFAFPLEICATAVAGREYAHYFMTWLPAAAVLGAWAVKWLASLFRHVPSKAASALGLASVLVWLW